MALPNAETGVIEMVQEEEAAQKQADAIAAVNAGSKEVANTKPNAVDTVQELGQGGDPMDFLHAQGIDEIKIDYTSFPLVVLNNGKFATAEHKLGESFQFVYMTKRTTTLMSLEVDRDNTLLAYSDDGQTCNSTSKPLNELADEWAAQYPDKVKDISRKLYEIIIAMAVDGPHDGEIIQLQIPPASQGKLGGYLYSLGLARVSPKSVITEASIGPEVGSGQKAFTPWVFKRVRNA